ncbi:Uu.00g002130.m01.CDS01 [Anthostomella pinea]|uniref:Uu.00g002130.m01.CDS01 n=1 Tax=Anthostomella pinea TaxID=933095 RepID=A0AAI8VE73_9PEZI|nr:Uu.00g002130.m01.CDS01 [Anthostomella pinea]
MTDSNSGHSSTIEQTPLDSNQNGPAQNIIDEQKSNYGTTTQADLGSSMEGHGEAVKDQVDGALAKGPKKADADSGGRVMVAETGDLHDLAAKRQP